MTFSYKLSLEDHLTEFYQSNIQPFWQQGVCLGDFVTHDQLTISYAFIIHPQSIGSIVISTGRIEAYLKYKEVIFDLYQNGYSVFIHDHRGQGLSARMTENPHMGYVEDFSDYVTDLELFMQLVVLPNSKHNLSLLCHSMGSAIGALYCLSYPERFKKVIFLAPMFGIKPALPTWLAAMLVKLHFSFGQLLGRQYGYFMGQKDYVSHKFANNKLTQSEVRYTIFRQEYLDTPEVQLGGVTGHWLQAAAKAMDLIEQRAHELVLPVLAIQAGNDLVVDNVRQRRVVAKLKNYQLTVIDGAKHEVLMEQDHYRVPAMQAVLAFCSGK
jgi:lysophospholipase